MTSNNGQPFSDSVNLGSNPSSPATTNADKTGVSGNSSPVEQQDITEQTAHGDRTKTGTVPAHIVVQHKGWSYVVGPQSDGGPWRYQWEAQEYADELNGASK